MLVQNQPRKPTLLLQDLLTMEIRFMVRLVILTHQMQLLQLEDSHLVTLLKDLVLTVLQLVSIHQVHLLMTMNTHIRVDHQTKTMDDFVLPQNFRKELMLISLLLIAIKYRNSPTFQVPISTLYLLIVITILTSLSQIYRKMQKDFSLQGCLEMVKDLLDKFLMSRQELLMVFLSKILLITSL